MKISKSKINFRKTKLNGLDQKKFSITLNNLRHSNEVVRFYLKKI